MWILVSALFGFIGGMTFVLWMNLSGRSRSRAAQLHLDRLFDQAEQRMERSYWRHVGRG